MPVDPEEVEPGRQDEGPGDRFSIGSRDPITVYKKDGRRIDYHTPSPGLVTVTQTLGDSEVMTLERFHELEDMPLL